MHGRKKRDTQYSDYYNSEVAEPVAQTTPVDYEELSDELYDMYRPEEKRYLGM